MDTSGYFTSCYPNPSSTVQQYQYEVPPPLLQQQQQHYPQQQQQQHKNCDLKEDHYGGYEYAYYDSAQGFDQQQEV